MKPKEKKMS